MPWGSSSIEGASDKVKDSAVATTAAANFSMWHPDCARHVSQATKGLSRNTVASTCFPSVLLRFATRSQDCPAVRCTECRTTPPTRAPDAYCTTYTKRPPLSISIADFSMAKSALLYAVHTVVISIKPSLCRDHLDAFEGHPRVQ